MILTDIPGFLKPKNLLTEKLNGLILSTLKESDIILAVVDVYEGIGKGDYFVFENLKNQNKPVILALNKIDMVNASRLKEEKEKLKEFDFFKEIISISALEGKNIKLLIRLIKRYLPEGPAYFPDDILSDRPLRNIVEDIIREKLISKLNEELPHSVNVEIERFEDRTTNLKEKITSISANIFVQKKSHKSIIIGKQGSFLKECGQKARLEIEELIGNKVFLELWVKVRENWTKDENALRDFGYGNN